MPLRTRTIVNYQEVQTQCQTFSSPKKTLCFLAPDRRAAHLSRDRAAHSELAWTLTGLWARYRALPPHHTATHERHRRHITNHNAKTQAVGKDTNEHAMIRLCSAIRLDSETWLNHQETAATREGSASPLAQARGRRPAGKQIAPGE
jgi:hypothetical protein